MGHISTTTGSNHVIKSLFGSQEGVLSPIPPAPSAIPTPPSATPPPPQNSCTLQQFSSPLYTKKSSIEPLIGLTIRSLITLRQHASYNKCSDATVTGLLRRLGSLLSNVNLSDNSLPIIPLHTSFRDFLINQDKSGDFCVPIRDAHYELAHSCLNLLLDPVDGLKFNICKLETLYLANDDVEDLIIRVDQYIPPALSYACRFWDDHLKHTDFTTDLFRKVFKKTFLF